MLKSWWTDEDCRIMQAAGARGRGGSIRKAFDGHSHRDDMHTGRYLLYEEAGGGLFTELTCLEGENEYQEAD
jgi:hypothetical protein